MKIKYKYEGGVLQLTANNNRDRAILNHLFQKGVWTQRLALDSNELDICPLPAIPSLATPNKSKEAINDRAE